METGRKPLCWRLGPPLSHLGAGALCLPSVRVPRGSSALEGPSRGGHWALPSLSPSPLTSFPPSLSFPIVTLEQETPGQILPGIPAG